MAFQSACSSKSSSEREDSADDDYLPPSSTLAPIDHSVIRALLLSPLQETTIEELVVVLKDCKSVSKRLQKEECTLYLASELCNKLVELYPSLKSHLAANANVVPPTSSSLFLI